MSGFEANSNNRAFVFAPPFEFRASDFVFSSFISSFGFVFRVSKLGAYLLFGICRLGFLPHSSFISFFEFRTSSFAFWNLALTCYLGFAVWDFSRILRSFRISPLSRDQPFTVGRTTVKVVPFPTSL